MIEKHMPGMFPVFNRDTNGELFVQHSQSMPQRVESNGEIALTGYLKLSEAGVKLYDICQLGKIPSKLYLKELAYVDDGDNLKIHPLNKMAVIELSDKAYNVGNERIVKTGFVTKLNGLRWGFNLEFNINTGLCKITSDKESPVVGLKLHFA
jgi:hypothetical protein